MFKQIKRFGAVVPVALLSVVGGSAHAALAAAVTDAIDAAETDMLALYAALTAAGVLIWVGRLVYRHFTVR